MNVSELNQAQLNELKINYICALAHGEGRYPDMSEIANAPKKISNDLIQRLFKNMIFEERDFIRRQMK